MSETKQDSESKNEKRLRIGDVVHDRDDSDSDAAFVARFPEENADEYIAYEETTVAEDNPEYPADSDVVVVVFGQDVQFNYPSWDRLTALESTEIEEAGMRPYSFPAPRLSHHYSQKRAGEETSDSEESEGSDSEESEGVNGTVQVGALGDRMSVAGWDVRSDGDDLVMEKGGESYRIQPDGVIEGEGDFRTPLENLVDNYTE